ncbi:MAG: hypothetical protein K2O00_00810 [Muribaculaceae bacterium]|nr:hypothetical protein [Muribaculaceae bacterium]
METPFQYLLYERSQRGILQETIPPGQAWHNGFKDVFPQTELAKPYSRRVSLLTNVDGKDGIDRYEATANGVRVTGKYSKGTLLLQTESDEDGKTTVTATDFRGLTVMLKNPYVTRYVYNDFGQLAYILPPGLSGTHNRSDAEMQQLAYWYDYDSRGRMVTKKLPGVREIYYIYDNADRLVAEQSPAFADGVWRLYAYDRLDRCVLTLDCSITRPQAQQFADRMSTADLDGGPLAGYTLPGLPLSNPKIVNASYYDNHDFISLCGLPDDFKSKQPASHTGVQFPISLFNYNGLKTGTFTGRGYEAYYYDNCGRLRQRFATGFNTGRTTFTYNYSGLVAATVHEPPDEKDAGVTIMRYSYDSCGRPVKTEITKSFLPLQEWNPVLPLKSAPLLPPSLEFSRDKYTTTLTTNYNSLGQIATTTHGAAATRSYTYNLHGALKTTVTQLLGKTLSETLHYETGKYPAYNGNISAKEWTNGRYDYRYDSANRLIAAEFDTSHFPYDYSTAYTYDERSNPLSIMRQGQIDPPSHDKVFCGDLDYITTGYTGNQLTSINAHSNILEFEGQTGLCQKGIFTFQYDSAGRLVKDQARDIRTIEYDNNSRPVSMTFYDGDCISENYDGLGNHISTVYNRNRANSRIYTGAGHIYTLGKLQMERVPGGYFNFNTRRFYHYITDYQGNNIAVVSDSGAIVHQTDYFPYGEPWSEPSHPFTYSDNERLHAFGQNQYDFNARRLISTLLRFDSVDPLAEATPWHSPYNFCFGNPIRYTDKSGLFVDENKAKEWANKNISGDYAISFEDGLWTVVIGENDYYYAQYDDLIPEAPNSIFCGAYCLPDECSTDTYLCEPVVSSTADINRWIVPDALTVGFDASVYLSGIGVSWCGSLTWITRGPDASITPHEVPLHFEFNKKIGLDCGAQFFRSQSYYSGDVENIKRELLGIGDNPYPQYGLNVSIPYREIASSTYGIDICNDSIGETMYTISRGVSFGPALPLTFTFKRFP